MYESKSAIEHLLTEKPLYLYQDNNKNKKEEWENDIVDHLVRRQSDVLKEQSVFYARKQTLSEVEKQMHTFSEMLRRFSRSPRNTLEYLKLKGDIVSYFHTLTQNPIRINEFFQKNESPADDIPPKEATPPKKPRKTKQKKKEPHFPFLNKDECTEKAPKKPTFVKKGDILKMFGKLGYPTKTKDNVPLSSLTKDELCELYFQKE